MYQEFKMQQVLKALILNTGHTYKNLLKRIPDMPIEEVQEWIALINHLQQEATLTERYKDQPKPHRRPYGF